MMAIDLDEEDLRRRFNEVISKRAKEKGIHRDQAEEECCQELADFINVAEEEKRKMSNGNNNEARYFPKNQKPKTQAPAIEMVLVTPEIAKEWEKLNLNNRPINDVYVDELVAFILADKFTTTHQGIAFDAMGRLLDGQHRLRAIIKANKAVMLMVVRGLPPEARLCVDTGRRRSIAQILQMTYGEQNTHRVMSFIRVIADLTGDSKKVSAEDAEQRIEYYRPAIAWALRAFSVTRFNAPVVGALIYAYRTNPEKVQAFGASLVSGANLPPKSPVLALMKAMQLHPKPTNTDRRLVSILTLRAVLGYIKNESLAVLKPSEEWVKYFGHVHNGEG